MAAPMKHVEAGGSGDKVEVLRSPRCSSCCAHTQVPQRFSEDLNTTLNQLKAEDNWKLELEDGFNSKNHWSNHDKIMKILHKEVTKLSLSYCSPPRPACSDAAALFLEPTRCVLALVSSIYHLPLSEGRLLCEEWRRFYITLLSAFHEFSLALWGAGGEKRIHQQTGVIWEMCKASESMPKTNHHCLVQKLEQVSALVEDALSELEEAKTALSEGSMEMYDDDEPKVSEYDVSVLIAGLGLVKTSKMLVKKCLKTFQVNGRSNTTKQVQDSDNLSYIFSYTSERVDDFSASLYPPSNKTEIKENITPLVQHLDTVITAIRESHFCTESDTQWINMIENAVTHNGDKIHSLVT